jgi:hypothetical protein
MAGAGERRAGGDELSDPVATGVEHLQVAATELIAAARAFLDAAEQVVADPERFHGVAEALTDLARGVGRAVATEASPGRDRAPGVEHIRVG